MIPIQYIKGDATQPIKKPAVICHICNDIGKWGKGFVLALSERWKTPENSYKKWYWGGRQSSFHLGNIHTVPVEEGIHVCNMVAQHGIGGHAIRYGMLGHCLEKLGNTISNSNRSVHMPRIGCGLAGGEWMRVVMLVTKNLSDKDIEVFVYDI